MKFKKHHSLFFVLLVVFLLELSCDKNNNTSEVDLEKHKSEQLTDLFTNEITPLNASFVTAVQDFKNTAEDFNNNPSTDKLETLKNKWSNLAIIWKQIEVYYIKSMNSSVLYYNIHYWPADTERIENHINSQETINTTLITNIGSNKKGISALEYLLFNKNTSETFSNLASETNATRRKEYLTALSNNLHENVLALNKLWTDYKTTFLNSLGEGINGSHNKITNSLIACIGDIIITKLEKPLATSNHALLEAFTSEHSIEFIKAELETVKRCFTGDFPLSKTKIGFDDYLKLYDAEELSDQIITELDKCIIDADAIPSLKETLKTQPEKIQNLINSLKNLLLLIKVDMANTIGTTITFSDTDGD